MTAWELGNKMNANRIEDCIRAYINGKPFELIVYQKKDRINHALTVDLSHFSKSMQGVPERTLSSYLKKEFAKGELFENKNNVFPYLIFLTQLDKIPTVLNYTVGVNSFQLINDSKVNPYLTQRYRNAKYNIAVNFYL